MATTGAQTVVACGHCGARNRVPSTAAGGPRCGRCHEPLPWVVDATDDTFAAVADRARLPVVVDVWAPWCGPCRQVSPVLAALAADLAGRIKLVKVDADQSPALSRRFDVQAIPTLLVLNRGTVVARQVGAAPGPVLRRWVEDALAASAGDAT